MTLDELLLEASGLARPCTYLVPGGPGPSDATWGGAGLFPGPDPESEHWLTVNAKLLPPGIRQDGVLSLFVSESGATPILKRDASVGLDVAGTPLQAVPATSLPPIDALFRFGSPRLHGWLREKGWDPEWGYNTNFADPVAGQYESAFQDQFPLYTAAAYAVIGGWHFPWPDDDWVDLLEDTLVLTTFHESEPWVEVWLTSAGVLLAIPRVT